MQPLNTKAYSGTTAQSNEPEKLPSVQIAGSRLSNSISSLEATIDTLKDRLTPVLAAVPVAGGGGGAGVGGMVEVKIIQATAPLADDITNQAIRVERAHCALDKLLCLLEI